jgi:LemA protein
VLSGEFTGNTRVQLENQITRAMGDFLALVETYPELKANQNFIYLLESLNEIEEQISAARRFYNTAVTDYNNAIQMFPTNLVAYRMNYRLIRLFEVSPASRQNVNVKNLFEQ